MTERTDTDAPTGSTAAPAFAPPGPGRWELDRSHYPGGTTRIAQWWMESAMEVGMAKVFAELGTPASTLKARFVNGFMYTRLHPLIGADKASTKLPPIPVLKLAARLHPAFRARRSAAQRALEERPWLAVAQRWDTELKPALVARNNELQAVDLRSLDDAALQAHIVTLLEHCREQLEVHFWLHGYDLGPLANYVHSCLEWGISGSESLAALAGASPSTAVPVQRLARLRALLDAAGVVPSSLDDVRAALPEAAALLDEHLAERGAHLVTRYDIDGLTLGELPGVLLSGIRDATDAPEHDHRPIASSLRARVPADQREEFDRLLSDARRVMDVRDDNGPNTYEWPAGLFRLALLEAGRRLALRGALVDAEHVLELDATEVRTCLTTCPPASTLAQRAVERAALSRATPPVTLGPAELAPPLDVLPAPLPRMVAMVQTALEQLGMLDTGTKRDGLTGVGIGTERYRGTVRRAGSPEEAIDTMEPGDVLVVRATSPAFNAVLSIAGAVVTADGGAMSHAAVLARELGIPAIVGATAALDLPDGALVELDPVAGTVRVV